MTRPLHIPRGAVFSALFSLYAVVFLATPYWGLAVSPGGRISLVVFTTAAGALWALWSSGDIFLSLTGRDAARFGLLAGIAVLINARALSASIPWKGDEDYHIRVMVDLWRLLSGRGALLLLLGLAVTLTGLKLRPRRNPLLPLFAAACILFAISLLRSTPNLQWTTRYPVLGRWVGLALLYPLEPLFGLYRELNFRLPPLLAVTCLAWLCSSWLERRGHGLSAAAAGIAVLTIPSVRFYSSTLYLETAALPLMLLVCLRAGNLLSADCREVLTDPGWYGLILVGFVKETTAPFIGAFLLCRLLARMTVLTGRDARAPARIRDELKLFFSVLFPLALYLLYRALFASAREPGRSFDHLALWGAYPLLGRAWIEQFGPFCLLFLAGAYLLLRRGKGLLALFLACTLVFDITFHLLDDISYLGYSRFSFFLLPAVLAASLTAVRRLSLRRSWAGAAVLLPLLVSNIILSPVLPDGSKKSFWGTYGPLIAGVSPEADVGAADTAEHYYPYREAFEWIRSTYGDLPLRLTGMDYPYLAGFYFSRLGWFPPGDEVLTAPAVGAGDALRLALSGAERDGLSVVLYHVTPGREATEEAPLLHGFSLARSFSAMSGRRLIVYARALPAGAGSDDAASP